MTVVAPVCFPMRIRAAGPQTGCQSVGARAANQLSQGGGGAGRCFWYHTTSLERCQSRVPSKTRSTACPRRKESPIHSGCTSLIHAQNAAAEKAHAIRLIRRKIQNNVVEFTNVSLKACASARG